MTMPTFRAKKRVCVCWGGGGGGGGMASRPPGCDPYDHEPTSSKATSSILPGMTISGYQVVNIDFNNISFGMGPRLI